MILALALAIAIAPEVLPFGSTVTLPPGSVKIYSVSVTNTNSFGPFLPSTGGWLPASGWSKVHVKGSSGWDTYDVFKSEKELWWTGNNGNNLCPMWTKDGKLFQDAWVAMALTVPMGVSKREAYPQENALKIVADGCRISVASNGSPSRGLLIVGSGNVIDVSVTQGIQTNDKQDLAAVRVEGSYNQIGGFIASQGCALFLKGKSNTVDGLYAKGLSVLDDAGLVYVSGGSDGTIVRNTVLVQEPRKYEPSWMTTLLYLDDRASYCTVEGSVTLVGGWYPVYSHGGSFNRVYARSEGCKSPVKFAPHFTTPTVLPVGNVDGTVAR